MRTEFVRVSVRPVLIPPASPALSFELGEDLPKSCDPSSETSSAASILPQPSTTTAKVTSPGKEEAEKQNSDAPASICWPCSTDLLQFPPNRVWREASFCNYCGHTTVGILSPAAIGGVLSTEAVQVATWKVRILLWKTNTFACLGLWERKQRSCSKAASWLLS